MKLDVMKAYWLNLSERDRFVLSVGGVFVLIYIFYQLLYAPLINAVETKSNQFIEKKETLAWMRSQAKTMPSNKPIESNLLSVFSSQLKTAPFSQYPYQLQQAGEDHVQLSFDSVPYVDCLIWLRRLNEQYAMTITEFSAIRSSVAGVAKVRITAANLRKGS